MCKGCDGDELGGRLVDDFSRGRRGKRDCQKHAELLLMDGKLGSAKKSLVIVIIIV